ncbi:MAG: hypothetical protein SOZ62_02650 [Eubacteriales bacterium]|nr:hypothetical protein [Eubacteriales bacterium]
MKKNPYATNSGGMVGNVTKTAGEPKSTTKLGNDLRIKGGK